MRKIIISEKNRERLESALKAAQGRATARTVDYIGLMSIVKQLEEQLPPVARKADLKGTKATYCENGGGVAKAYTNKYGMPHGTFIDLVYTGRAWALVGVMRDYIRGRSLYVTLPDKALSSIAERYREGFF